MSVPLLLLKLLSLSFLNILLKWEGSLYLNVNCLKSGCSSLAKGKQIKEMCPKKKKKEMCLRPRPITFRFFLSWLMDVKCYFLLYVYIYICICMQNVYRPERKFHKTIFIYIPQAVHIPFFHSNLFHFFKNTV